MLPQFPVAVIFPVEFRVNVRGPSKVPVIEIVGAVKVILLFKNIVGTAKVIEPELEILLVRFRVPDPDPLMLTEVAERSWTKEMAPVVPLMLKAPALFNTEAPSKANPVPVKLMELAVKFWLAIVRLDIPLLITKAPPPAFKVLALPL